MQIPARVKNGMGNSNVVPTPTTLTTKPKQVNRSSWQMKSKWVEWQELQDKGLPSSPTLKN